MFAGLQLSSLIQIGIALAECLEQSEVSTTSQHMYMEKNTERHKAPLRNEEKYVNIIWICRHATRNKQEPTHCLATTWRCSAEIAFTVSTEILWKRRAQMVFSLLLRE